METHYKKGIYDEQKGDLAVTDWMNFKKSTTREHHCLYCGNEVIYGSPYQLFFK
jgi:hypothetical protein